MIICSLDLEYKAKGRVVIFLDKLQSHLGRKFLNRKIEKSIYNEDWFQATFEISDYEGSREEVIYDFLRLAQLIEGRSWLVHGPREMESIFIDAYLDNTHDDQPLKSAYLRTEITQP